MKLTSKELKKIIKEELQNVLEEENKGAIWTQQMVKPPNINGLRGIANKLSVFTDKYIRGLPELKNKIKKDIDQANEGASAEAMRDAALSVAYNYFPTNTSSSELEERIKGLMGSDYPEKKTVKAPANLDRVKKSILKRLNRKRDVEDFFMDGLYSNSGGGQILGLNAIASKLFKSTGSRVPSTEIAEKALETMVDYIFETGRTVFQPNGTIFGKGTEGELDTDFQEFKFNDFKQAKKTIENEFREALFTAAQKLGVERKTLSKLKSFFTGGGFRE